MALLKCTDVSEGLRASEATVTIEEHDGTSQFFPIDRGVLSDIGGVSYLSVRLIHLNDARGIALVGLPVEADSGVNRIWARYEDFLENPAVPELAR